METENTTTLSRMFESILIDLLKESKITHQDLKDLIEFPEKRRDLIECLVSIMSNESIENMIETLEDN